MSAGGTGHRLVTVALVLLCGGMWGVTFTCARIASAEGHHPLGLALWQAIGGGVVLLAISLARGRRLPFDARHLTFYAFCGLVGTAIPLMLTFEVAKHLSAGVLSILLATVPLLTYGLSVAIGIDSLALRRALGIVLGLVAIFMLVVPEEGLGGGTAPFWVLIGIVVPLCYTAENVYLGVRRPPATDSVTLVAGMMLTGGLVLLPVVAATGTAMPMLPPWGPGQWATVAMFTVNSLSYSLFLFLIARTGPVFAGQTGYVVTLSGVLWGMALLGEQHSAWVWAALAVMIAGMSLVRERRVVAVGD